MLDLAKRAVEMAASVEADEVEAFAMHSRSLRIKVYRQEVEELASATSSGIGIRIFKDKSVGYAYASELSEDSISAAVREAAETARVTAPDEYNGLPQPENQFPEIELYSERVAATPLAEKIAMAAEIEKAALERDERISQVEGATYAEGEGTVAIANSLGFGREYRETSCYNFVQTIAEQEGQMQTGMSFSTGRHPQELQTVEVGREAADRALSLLGGTQSESLVCPVIMDPFVTASLIGVIASALTGESVQKQRSMFSGMEGQPVAATILNLTDDGRHPHGLGSAPFDGEGVPTRKTVLIKNGVLQAFLFDAYSGRKAGKSSTGNGLRGSYRSMPHVGASNLTLAGGDRGLAEMLSGIDLGFYVMEASGIHSGANAVSGDFSVGAAGRLIRGGNLSDPVREVTIAGNLHSILGSIEAVGNDNRWVPFGGSIHAPSLLIGEMAVSGK